MLNIQRIRIVGTNTESDYITDRIITTVRIITDILTVTITTGDTPTTIPEITERKSTNANTTKSIIIKKITTVIVFAQNTNTDITRDPIITGSSIATIIGSPTAVNLIADVEAGEKRRIYSALQENRHDSGLSG